MPGPEGSVPVAAASAGLRIKPCSDPDSCDAWEFYLHGFERLVAAAQPALHERQLHRQRRQLLLNRLLADVLLEQVLPPCRRTDYSFFRNVMNPKVFECGN